MDGKSLYGIAAIFVGLAFFTYIWDPFVGKIFLGLAAGSAAVAFWNRRAAVISWLLILVGIIVAYAAAVITGRIK